MKPPRAFAALYRLRCVFKKLSTQQICDYVATGEPLDKAGSYGLQDLGKNLVAEVIGSRSNVIGLPMDEVVADLEQLGIITSND